MSNPDVTPALFLLALPDRNLEKTLTPFRKERLQCLLPTYACGLPHDAQRRQRLESKLSRPESIHLPAPRPYLLFLPDQLSTSVQLCDDFPAAKFEEVSTAL